MSYSAEDFASERFDHIVIGGGDSIPPQHREEYQAIQNRTPVLDPKSSRARILELEAQIERLNKYQPAVEFASGRDKWDIDEWTISDNPDQLPHLGCCGRRAMKRTVLRGPWEEVDGE